MARICNAEWVRLGMGSGHERKTLSLSDPEHPLDDVLGQEAKHAKRQDQKQNESSELARF
jgi:hypothetical protein